MAVNFPIAASLLLGLPSEIIELIISTLPNNDLLRALHTCQRLNDIAKRILYRRIHLNIVPSWGPNFTVIGSNIHQLHILDRNLFLSPHLRRHVWDLHVETYLGATNAVTNPMSALVCLTPGLRSLRLRPTPPNLDLHHLTDLRRLHLSFYRSTYASLGDDPISCPRIVFGALQLPRLETLFVEHPNGLKQQWRTQFSSFRQRIRICHLTTLRILEVDTSFMLMLPLVLRSIAGLQRFTFHFSRVADFEDFCPLKLCHAITRHGKTLMELNISYPGVEWFDVSEAFGRRLASFPRLRRLAIPDSFLFPYSNDQTECSYRERLPASLQDLQLQCAFSFDDWEDDDFAYADERHMRIKRLRRLAGPMEEQLPELRRVVWWDQEDRFGEEDLWARGFEQQLAELRTYLRRRIGVSFELMSFLEWQDTPFGKVEGNEFD